MGYRLYGMPCVLVYVRAEMIYHEMKSVVSVEPTILYSQKIEKVYKVFDPPL